MELTKPTLSAAIRSLAVVGAGAALLAGCSSTDTKNEYVDTVNEIQIQAVDAYREATASTPSNQAGFVRQLRQGEEAIAAAVARLGAVEVPGDAEDDHPDLVASFDDLRALFGQAAKDVKRSDASGTLNAVTDFSTDGAQIGAQIDAAIDQINDALGAT